LAFLVLALSKVSIVVLIYQVSHNLRKDSHGNLTLKSRINEAYQIFISFKFLNRQAKIEVVHLCSFSRHLCNS
jgi:hypothetical protein